MDKIDNRIVWISTVLAMVLVGCSANERSQPKLGKMEKGTFGYDVEFLNKHTNTVVLRGGDSLASVLITPKMQGRVMTSSINGNRGKSLGWVNHELIESGEIQEHFTPYGGEDRFWIAPEGGQFSVFIKAGKEMVFENWYVPPGLNTEPWELVAQSDTQVTVEKKLNLQNYSGTEYNLNVNRLVKLYDKSQIEKTLDISLSAGIKHVGYVSQNTIMNTGEEPWTKNSGAPAIWILSMFRTAPGVTVAIPYKNGPKEELGSVVTSDYFGDTSSERLKINDGIIYFKTDGKKRRKLGVSPRRASSVAGSYDETNNILTIIKYSFPQNNSEYVNQQWQHQENPYNGKIVFAYDDGPLEDGSQLGPFYELESSSPAAFLEPGETLTHEHQVYHFTGDRKALNQISERLLGVGLEPIISAF